MFVFVLLGSLAFAEDAKVDFVRDIQPIFSSACYSCHGPEKQKGDLRLDSKPLAMKGGSGGASIVPGKGKDSLLVQRIRGLGDEARMPVKAPPLSEQQIALVERWINEGANWPDTASVADAKILKHWAYIKPVRPSVAQVKSANWPRNPIDNFVLAKLEKEGMSPSPEATRETLVRRVTLDLTGLPPTPQEVDAFVADKSPDAYEKLVDRLLASPHYGERWARPWLDLARYADTNGFNFDTPRSIWKYRDWVVNALNSDMSFKEFTIEQIAGDLLPNATIDQKIATGFHRNTMVNDEGGVDKDEARWETLLDRVNTTATVWLGSTMNCSQCHNHKYDPFKQKEYYQFLAFFENAEEPVLKIGDAKDPEKHDKLKKEIEQLEAQEKAGKADKKTKDNLAKLKKQLQALDITTLVMQEKPSKEPPSTEMRIKGSYVARGERVFAATPAFLHPFPKDQPRNRLGLANWLVDDNNPLVARVVVNRFWEQLFGRGIVETSEDFGTQCSPPTHPELLDWLAVEFMGKGWSMKSLVRLIVTSATYRQSSKITPELLQRDPYNKLYARGARYRLEAEMLRDLSLSVCGDICLKIGGPAVFPPAPDDKGFIANNKGAEKWTPSAGEDRYRRGLYTFWRRTAPFPMFVTFDAPSREFCSIKRSRTNTPLQALSGLNDPGSVEAARSLAKRMLSEGGKSLAERIAYGFRLCTSRIPDSAESKDLIDAFNAEFEHFKTDPKAAQALVSKVVIGENVSEWAALTMISNVLLNLDETVTHE